MTLRLADVRDLDCVLSFSPLRIGLSSRTVSGVPAILRRVLYRWCTPRGKLPWDPSVGLQTPIQALRGAVLSERDRFGMQEALRREAKAEDFVDSATVSVTLDGGVLRIRAGVTLIDGVTYPLEVDITGAVAALQALASETA